MSKTKFKTTFLILILIVVSVMIIDSSAPKNKKFIFSDDKNSVYIFETENGGKSLRCLTFSPEHEAGSRQGCIFKKYPEKIVLHYAKLMLEGFEYSHKKEKVLMLGLGIGTIPQNISQNYPNTKIDIVDIEPSMPEVAENFFGFKQTENMTIFIQDAYEFVINSKEKYDVIFMDIFDSVYIPHQFLTEDFVLHLKRLLNKDGMLIVNTFVNSPTYAEEEELFSKFFKFTFQTQQANRILIVSDSEINNSL